MSAYRQLLTLTNFNPRTRAGCDHHRIAALIESRIFQSTHPCWVRLTMFVLPFSSVSKISIHAPVLGATNITATRRRTMQYFNPRTRAGCDLGSFEELHKDFLNAISIHAPVLGATGYAPHAPLLPFGISIHAPVLGATSVFVSYTATAS